jgi:glyoxylase-like metal-dependent hydrolase (beta-lactamase superfamily II)
MMGTRLHSLTSALAVGDHVVRLQEPDGERWICQFIVHGADASLIVDAGLPGSAQRSILPALRRGVAERPQTLLLTHPDSDHCGGASELAAALPSLTIVCHRDDRDALGDPERTIESRYRAFAGEGIEPAPQTLLQVRRRLGGPFIVARGLGDGHDFELGGVECRLVHLPGHSPGHCGVWLPAERILIGADAAMGRGIPRMDGTLLYAPQFLSPTVYRATLERIAALRPAALLCTHEPLLAGAEIDAFLDASRRSVDTWESLVEAVLHSVPLTLPAICDAVYEAHGGLPEGRVSDIALTVAGILETMAASGRAVCEHAARGRAWTLS